MPCLRVKQSGRVGEVLKHDPADKTLTYKLGFTDGLLPDDDWLPEDCVEDVPPLIVDVHSAALDRSFAKLGDMSPFAIVKSRLKKGEATEVLRTTPHASGHKAPKWDANHIFEDMPLFVDVEVWDKNTFHKNVFCGSVSIPCSSERLEKQEFTLEKKGKTTGSLCISMRPEKLMSEEARTRAATHMTQATHVGAELDDMLDFQEREDGSKKAPITLQQEEMPAEADGEQDEEEEVVESPMSKAKSTPSAGFSANAIVGSWKCVGTNGLDEFLIKSGASIFQRKIAKAAKWPAWDYIAKGDDLVFVNHSAIGDITEEFPIGTEYEWRDGKRNAWKCQATWTPTADGGSLVHSREGVAGSYTEERVVSGDKLEFTLTNPACGASWGRTFTRE